MHPLIRISTVVIAFELLLSASQLAAQTLKPRPPTSADKKPKATQTKLRFELLTGKSGVGLRAQEWGRIFQQMGIRLRIRRAILDDKPELKERTRGSTRDVTVIGKLERDGRIVFPGKSFTQNDTPKLVEWVKELKTYGAQGSPHGQPAFGLNELQFSRVYDALRQPVSAKLEGLTLSEAANRLALAEKFPIRHSASAISWLHSQSRQQVVRQTLTGLSKGTALAILLNNQGLGFRPTRTPSGSIEFVVDPLDKTVDRWPIGWPLRGSRLKTAPKLFKMVPVDLDDVPLKDVLYAVSIKSEVPILIDYYRSEAKGIDVTKLKVSVLPKRTSWIQLLRTVTNPNKLTRKLLVDEQGRPFIWVTTLELGRKN